MAIRGVRGATTVGENTKDEIILKTQEMLNRIIEINGIAIDDIASAVFSVTEDLDAEFPAVAARKLGWIYTPLFCTREIPVKGSLKNCIRALLHINTEMDQKDIIHVYLGEAKKLRPDIGTSENNIYYTSDRGKE
jgi:chorismate mutase